MIYLDVIALISFVLFSVLLIKRARKIRKANQYNKAGGFTIAISWLLIIIFFVSLFGISYGSYDPEGFNQLQSKLTGQKSQLATKNSAKQATSSSSSSKKTSPQGQNHSSKATSSKQSVIHEVSWDPKHPAMQGDSANVRFSIPKHTSVIIRGHNYHQKYDEIIPDNDDQRVVLQFPYAGTYDVIITHNGKQEIKQLVIN